ncbi:MAG: hypothetical protein EA427_01535 [Spirochaetaceae bacterium]|nr:MAG: hypothetical protein EA427_01535 [Spirochaetaceae bacterium]
MITTRRDTLTGILFVNIATFSWATNIILGRYLRAEIGPLALTATRYLVAALAFALILRNAPAAERRVGDDLKPLLAMAVTGIILFAPLLYFGLRYTTAVNSTLINGMGPLMTALFAAWLIKEPYTKLQLGGALLAMVGVVLLITGGSLQTLRETGVNPGDLVILVAAAVWGLYSVAGRRATRNRTPLSATALSIYMGLPILIVAALIEQRTVPVIYSPRLLLIILYLGVVPAALGFSLWNSGVKKLGTGGAMVFYNTLPLYGTILGSLLLGEHVGLPHLLGGTLIIGGGVVSALVGRKGRKR